MDEVYTTYIQNNVLSFIDGIDEEQEYKKLIDFLNSDEFRSFGDGLAYVINKKDKSADINSKTLEKYLKNKCEENGVKLSDIGSRNTFKGWFGATRPDKKSQNREKLFALSFALGLDIEEVKYLFHKVYLDRAFDYRNYKETVYYYCISKGYNFERAQNIIAEIEKRENKESIERKHTNSISREIETIKGDNDLIDWICKRWSNFQYKNETAIQIFKTLFERAKKASYDEYKTYEKAFSDMDNLQDNSTSSIYYIIFNCFHEKKATEKFNSIFNNSTKINNEIKTNFPNINTLREIERKIDSLSNDTNYDELRKNIILLKFYTFFRNVADALNKKIYMDECSIEDCNKKLEPYRESFIAEMNDLLNDCGMCELYAANPYDLIFIISMTTYNPIDTLRGIIAEIAYQDEDWFFGE